MSTLGASVVVSEPTFNTALAKKMSSVAVQTDHFPSKLDVSQADLAAISYQ